MRFLLVFLLLGVQASAQSTLSGRWLLLKDSSDFLSYWSDVSLEISDEHAATWTFQSRTPLVEKHAPGSATLTNRVWPWQNFLGFNYATPQTVQTRLLSSFSNGFVLQRKYQLRHAQGISPIIETNDYRLQKGLLTVKHRRNNRSGFVKYVFYRAPSQTAFVHNLVDNWDLNGGVGENAFFISLQGLVNRDSAKLYLDYPFNWEYKESGKLRSFYEKRLQYGFRELASVVDACRQFLPKRYIAWDVQSRASLCVAFTLAGLRNAVVVRADMVDLMDSLGLQRVEDLRGRFNGQSDAQVFQWLFDNYKDSCSKDYVTWMGGAEGHQIMPGIADFGIAQKTLFIDLSTDPKDSIEYALASRVMKFMKPYGLVMGWHSYGKDLERHYVTLASQHALRVEGLNTFPNLSFTSRTKPSADFKFRNNHNTSTPALKSSAYIACVQTDGLGLGSWNSPLRGSIPYAWEVTINWYWMSPVLLQYYYENATPNDFFFGALSGPGYLYPKAIPAQHFKPLMHIADTLCRALDLNIFETMDYSQGSSGTGNNDLPESLVRQYFEAMPGIIGMLNGYAPSGTFGRVGGKPFISYDYYLDESIPEATAIADLNELLLVNAHRPYFLALHVREWNDIERVKRILAGVKQPHEIVPLDVFMRLAARAPAAYKQYYRAE